MMTRWFHLGLGVTTLAVCASCVTPEGETETGASESAVAGVREVRLLAEYADFGTGIAYSNGTVYTTSAQERVVRMFDATTLANKGTIAAGRGPIRLTTDGDRLYVVNQWAQNSGDAFVSVVDTRTQRVVRALGVTTKAEGSDPDNYPTTGFPTDATVMDGRLYTTHPTNATPNILPVDIGTWRERRMIAAGSGPWHLTGASGELIVANERGMGDPNDDAIVEIDLNGRVLATHATPGFLGEAASAAGKGWVARDLPGWSYGLVMVVDPATHTTREIQVSAGPDGLAVAGGKVYVACRGSNHVDVIDATSEQVVESIDLAKADPPVLEPRSLAVSPSGDIFVRAIDNSSGTTMTKLYAVRR